MDNSNNVYILNFWFDKNYGACITAYALYKSIEKFHKNVFLADNMNYQAKLSYKNSFNKLITYSASSSVSIENSK